MPNDAQPGHLLTAGLIQLRDLPDNLWNADTLFLLTPARRGAEERARLAEEEVWGGEVHVSEDQAEIEEPPEATAAMTTISI